ncbi:MAG: lipid-A-disaccharide synthase [Xanthobacteraceae bacterium]
MTDPHTQPLDIFLVAGEASGDQLGGPLMAALRAQLGGRVRFRGVGGPRMGAEGLASHFPMEDLTVMGLSAVFARLPLIWRRLRETARSIAAVPPDLLILIDSPDFNQRVAKRVRRALPNLPIVKYVSPTIWVWRPGRAQAMRPNFDHVLALFPFEPEAHARLGGPPCTYVGHPLLERLSELRPSAEEQKARDGERPLVLVLPGSRRSEIHRLASVFGDTVARIAAARPATEFMLPTLPPMLLQAGAAIKEWAIKPRIVATDAEKYAAFRRARAALAASGTVTLELALAQVPTVAGYKVSALEAPILRRAIRSASTILPNLILHENVVPEFHQENCTAEKLAAALAPLLEEGPARRRQLDSFARLESAMAIGGEHPSERAARVALEVYEAKTGRRVG